MRSLLLALVSMSCACACDESQRAADPRAPAAPKAVAISAPSIAAPPTAAPPIAAPPIAAPPTAAPPTAASAVASDDNTAPAVAAADPRDATRRAAHDMLAQHCGECHESHRPTAKLKALAIFDLDKPDWPSRFDDHKYKAALMRLASKSDAARDTFIAFRDAELKATAAKPD
jgi:mono/diheme cytochrome c family protein